MRWVKIAAFLVGAALIFQIGVLHQKRNRNKETDSSDKIKDDRPMGVTVRVRKPQIRDMYETVRTTGTLEPLDTADIFAKLPGDIIDVMVQEGDVVEKGRILAKMDDKELNLNLKQAQSAYRQALVNYRNFEGMWKRNKKLYEEDLISEQQYEQVTAQYRVAKSQVKSAKVVVSEARLNLSYTKIKAPISGVVTYRNCEKFQKISAAEKLFEVSKLDTLHVKVRITEKELPDVKATRRPARIRVEALKGTELDRDFVGNVSFIGPVIDSSSGTVEVRVETNNSEGLLTSGMFTRVTIETRLHLSATAVPKQALMGEEGDYYLFVARPDENGRPVASRVDVKTGLSDDYFVEIVGGKIQPSDWVVTEGQNLLNEGDALFFASPEQGEEAPTGFSPSPDSEAGSTPL